MIKPQDVDVETIPYTMESIESVICERYKMPKEMLHEKTRRRALVRVRQFCMMFMVNRNVAGLADIGKFYGGFDHTSVLYSKNTVHEIMAVDKDYAAEVESLDKLITKKHMILSYTNKLLTKEEKLAINNKAVEDAVTILVNAINYTGVNADTKPLWANVTGPDGKLYKISIERFG